MKKIYIILSVIIVLIICSILLFVFKGNGKDNNKKKNDNSSKQQTKYEIKDFEYENLTIENINVETFKDYTLVNFEINNNSDEVYPEGNMVFNIVDSNVVLEEVSSYVSTINPKSSVEVELVLNDVYSSIDTIKIEK